MKTKQLMSLVDEVMPEVVRVRRFLHQNPELSGCEEQTARLVADSCLKLGLKIREGIGGHGILTTLTVDAALPWIALRADMDALPIQDGKHCDYASSVTAVSHACGHDVHTAILLGAAQLLCRARDKLQYNVAFVFQPAEETCDGASSMLQDHVFNEIKPEQIYAMHVYPYLPAGSIGLREGAMCAAADLFDVEILGRGGHAARPHECVDVVLVASQVIQALHQIIGRRVNPLHPAVLTIGQIHGGHAANVIPDHISFSGTVRSLHPDAHEEIRVRMDHIIRLSAESWGATARFTLRQATPVLCNDLKLLPQARKIFMKSLPRYPTNRDW